MANKESGFTLLEWLISTALGLSMLTFGLTLYINFLKTSYYVEQEQAVQQNAQIALAILAKDIRLSGFMGCPNTVKISNLELSHPFSEAIMGWSKGMQDTALPFPIQQSLITNDVLLVQYAEPKETPIKHARNHLVTYLHSSPHALKTTWLISDCEHAETLQLDHIHLKHHYLSDARLSPFRSFIYYVAPVRLKKGHSSSVCALYRQDLNALDKPTEIVENIQGLELFYHVMDHSNQLKQVSADQVTDWDDVRSITIKLSLTVSTPYLPMYFGSKHNKRCFQQTITIRNRQRCLV